MLGLGLTLLSRFDHDTSRFRPTTYVRRMHGRERDRREYIGRSRRDDHRCSTMNPEVASPLLSIVQTAQCDDYFNRLITSEALTEVLPPASGVIVSDVEFPLGLFTLRSLLVDVVVTNDSPISWDVPVALPTTV